MPTVLATPPAARPRLTAPLPLSFELDADHEATRPPEDAGGSRDGVRLLVSPGAADPVLTRFAAIAEHLEPGDLLVVNTSATVAAAVDAVLDGGATARSAVIHVSTELPGGLWLVEPRRRIDGGSTEPLPLDNGAPIRARLGTGADTAVLHLLRHAPDSQRLWVAAPADGVDLPAIMTRRGRPIRYRYVPDDWPLDRYQSVFAAEPGSAEMPSASRPFTERVVADLVRHGIGFAAVTLHTGVSSLEGDERPYPERYRVPAPAAAFVNAAHRAGRRVIAVGTTVVRALETVTDESGRTHPGAGWTDVVIEPTSGVRAVDGIVTGWHEPEATHLAMLEAIAGRPPLVAAYEAAFANGYRWHEFGDSHLILR